MPDFGLSLLIAMIIGTVVTATTAGVGAGLADKQAKEAKAQAALAQRQAEIKQAGPAGGGAEGPESLGTHKGQVNI